MSLLTSSNAVAVPDDDELAALRAAARCGRSLPPVHLSELGEVFTQRGWRRAPVVS